jgi:hypothetical protein
VYHEGKEPGLRPHRPVLFVVALLSALLTSSPAVAADPAALYQEAKEHLAQQRYPFALETFKRALGLAPEAGVMRWRLMMGAALTYEKMDQKAFAIDYYQRFLGSSSGHPEAKGKKWARRRMLVADQIVGLENLLLEKQARVAIKSQPPGARVRVDGVNEGADGDAVTPCVVYLAPGARSVALDLDGHEPFETTARLVAGARETLSATLSEASRLARLIVISEAEDAAVFLDGARLGEGREVSREVEPGWRALMVTRPGMASFEQEVELKAGETLRVPARHGPAGTQMLIPLERSTGPYLSPLWGWIGAGGGGAMLATGVVFSVLAGTAHDDLAAHEEEFDPSRPDDSDYKDKWNDIDGRMTRNQTVAGVMYGLGGAVVVGSAVYLLVFADHGEPGAVGEPLVNLGVSPLRGGGGLTWIQLRF